MNQGAITLVLDLAGACERVSLPVGVGLCDAFQFSQEDLRVPRGFFRAPQESTVRRMCGVTAPDHHGHPPWIEVEVLAGDESVSTLDAEGLRG